MSNVILLTRRVVLPSDLLLDLKQEKLGARIRDQQMARQKATDEQDATIKAAVDKATTELRSAPSAPSEELTKQHAEELRAQEERLIAKHREELQKAVEAATAKAKESAPAPAPSPEAQKAATDAAVAAALTAKDAELRTKYQVEIEKAVESGRLEGTMKLRLKDTQLVRAQNKVKELEAQMEEWKKTGVVPGEQAPSASAPPPATATVPSPSTATGPSAAVPSPTTSAPHRLGAPALLTRKASVPAAAAAAGGATQPARGRGRGVARGGNIGIRGAGRGAGGPASGSTAGGAGEVAIMGAAAKRTREEGEVSTGDSLAKRLKPAVAAAAASTPASAAAAAADGSANAGGKPVTLQRNRVQPS